MKLTTMILRIDPAQGNVFEAHIPEPAQAIHGYVLHKADSALVMRDKPIVRSYPVLVFLVDPEAPPRRRRFISLLPGQVVDADNAEFQGRLQYIATIVNPNDGSLLVVFEAPPLIDAESRALDLPTAQNNAS